MWQTPNIASTKTIATGWGYTEIAGEKTSDELMKVELDIINNPQCNNYFDDGKLDNGIIDTQMCAGVLTGNKDTCNGGKSNSIMFLKLSNPHEINRQRWTNSNHVER